MNNAQDVLNQVSEVGLLLKRPVLRVNLPYLVLQVAPAVANEQRQRKAWQHLRIDSAEDREATLAADDLHDAGELFQGSEMEPEVAEENVDDFEDHFSDGDMCVEDDVQDHNLPPHCFPLLPTPEPEPAALAQPTSSPGKFAIFLALRAVYGSTPLKEKDLAKW